MFQTREDIILTPDEEQIILGTLLGDGCLTKGRTTGSSARLSCNHGEVQRPYVEWKAAHLKRLVTSVRTTNNGGYGQYNCRLTTVSVPSLRHLYDEIYLDGHKTIGPWIYRIAGLGLATWFMDDGQGGKCNTRSISTHSFGYDEQIVLLSWLSSVWNVKTQIRVDDRQQKYYLRIMEPGTSPLFDTIRPYIIPSMIHKMPNWDWPETTCPICQTVFRKSKPASVYCSKKCSKRAYYLRYQDDIKARCRDYSLRQKAGREETAQGYTDQE